MSAPYPILIGPILGYEWDETENRSYYTVLVRVTGATAPVWRVNGVDVKLTSISGKLHDGSHIWRGEYQINAFTETQGKEIKYQIKRGGVALKNVCNDSSWAFHLPAKQSKKLQPKIAFCSCNGFSDPNALRDVDPLAMWQRMEEEHKREPFSLLLMGGDQLYCDDLARKEGTFARLWNWLAPHRRNKEKPSSEEFQKAYLDHYQLAWCRVDHEGKAYPHTAMVRMMASIPSIMIWDDHDIFDGWGSYQAEEKKQPYYVEAFNAAKLAFELYQVRGANNNRALLDKRKTNARHYSQAVSLGPYQILVLDNRTHRTPDRIMDEPQWKHVTNWLDKHSKAVDASSKTLLVVSPVPVVYRKFHDWVSDLPGEHGTEDDLRDHWSHHQHKWEMEKLIAHLFRARGYEKSGEKLNNGFGRVTLVSGDVHVGAIGYLRRTDFDVRIGQVVSSAIIHPPPGPIQWAGIRAVSSDAPFEIMGQPVVGEMGTPTGAKDRYLICRNFAWFQLGSDDKLWVNWECEAKKNTDPKKVEVCLP